MRTKLLVLLAAAVLLVPAASIAQIGQTATLNGTVADQSGAVLPGVTVTVAGDALIGGTRVAVTDENGVYRFQTLPPGTYSVSAELSGFKPFTQQNVRIQLGQTITVDPRLEVGGFEDRVTVAGGAPVVDVKSSSAQKNLTEEVMENIPFTSRFGPGAMLLAPGVNPSNYSAYGSGGQSSNALLIDGVDVSDPESGTIWVFANHNWIQEVQIVGPGAPAEYGGFTGVASNSLFRSGSNSFRGLFETIFENDALTGSNVTDEILAENDTLTPATTDYNVDNTFQIGGPIKRDKLWFFTSFQYYRPKTAPSGYPPTPPSPYKVTGIGPESRLEKSPRFLFKPTVKLGTNDQLTGFFEAEVYNVDGRGASGKAATESVLRQDSPGVAWNGNYTKVLNSSSVFDIKYSGFWGYYYLSPYAGDDLPGWYDVDEDFYAVNSYYFYKADRVRNQANATVTKYASGFAGEHNLKFGAEFERSYIKSEWGYPGGFYVLAYSGQPTYAVMWDGYLKDNINGRLSAYAQDSWTIGPRFTLNPGIRFDRITGFNKALDEQVFATNSISPRIGFAWDVTGNSKTVVRGHYGWFFDGAKSTFYDPLDPGITPQYFGYLDTHALPDAGVSTRVTAADIVDFYLTDPGTNRTMDPDIKHPRMTQAIIGVEREVVPGLSLGAMAMYRKNDQFIDDVLLFSPGDFSTEPFPDAGPDGDIATTADNTQNSATLYRQLTDPLDNEYLITNPDGAERKYRGLEFTATKRMSSRWQLQASWNISKITGSYNNTSNAGNSTTEYNDPNVDPRFQPYRTGRLTNDNTHIGKVLFSYRAPFDILASGAYLYTTGATFTRTRRAPSGTAQGRADLFIEPRGTQRYDDQPRFDFKLEKQFRFGTDSRFGVTLEGFNVFNNAAITARTTRSGSTYFRPTGLVQPRRLRIGAVYRF